MAKKLKFESFIYHFLKSAKECRVDMDSADISKWDKWVDSLNFSYKNSRVQVAWQNQSGGMGSYEIDLKGFQFYMRGDDANSCEKQKSKGIGPGRDLVKEDNNEKFKNLVRSLAKKAGIYSAEGRKNMVQQTNARYEAEEEFHDQWASTVDVSKIDVRHMSEAITSPELRYIRKRLGDLNGKTLLDVGCGLGEASVYFAIEGANVTAMDISQGMLDTATKLAESNGVRINTHKSAAEETHLDEGQKFDIIYAGNLLHHVDIDATLKLLRPHLADDGVMVTWDPLAYNPIINVYRGMASDVRTEDEHPLKWADIKLFKKNFSQVETKYFWLTSLLIFILMALVQRRNPNKERFWKTVVEESDRWAPIYRPLELIDKFLLMILPPLRLLCWNVVIVARK